MTLEDYERRKAFLRLFLEQQAMLPIPPEHHPIAVLEATERKSPSQAVKGLQMALNDIIEMTIDWPPGQTAALDELLRNAGAVTLTELRAESSRTLRAIEKRGRIRNEVELYLVKNVLDGVPHLLGERRLNALQTMLDFYIEPS